MRAVTAREAILIAIFAVLFTLLLGGIVVSIVTKEESARSNCDHKWGDSGMPWRIKEWQGNHWCQIKVNGGWIPDTSYRSDR